MRNLRTLPVGPSTMSSSPSDAITIRRSVAAPGPPSAARTGGAVIRPGVGAGGQQEQHVGDHRGAAPRRGDDGAVAHVRAAGEDALLGQRGVEPVAVARGRPRHRPGPRGSSRRRRRGTSGRRSGSSPVQPGAVGGDRVVPVADASVGDFSPRARPGPRGPRSPSARSSRRDLREVVGLADAAAVAVAVEVCVTWNAECPISLEPSRRGTWSRARDHAVPGSQVAWLPTATSRRTCDSCAQSPVLNQSAPSSGRGSPGRSGPARTRSPRSRRRRSGATARSRRGRRRCARMAAALRRQEQLVMPVAQRLVER